MLSGYLPRFLAKNDCISSRHSASNTPDETVHFGCNALGAYTVNPRFSSLAPYTTRCTCAQPIAPAHINHIYLTHDVITRIRRKKYMTDIIIIGLIAIFVVIGILSGRKHFKGEGGCCGGGSTTVKKKKLKNVIAQKTIVIEGMRCPWSIFLCFTHC